ncbi:MAG: sigma 54-interacting transcriptional regulator [Acidobacteriota bacterium]
MVRRAGCHRPAGRGRRRLRPSRQATETPIPSALEDLLRDAPDLRAALPGIERAAAVDAPVLLLGEPGSGRTTLARAVHQASRRASGPLVEVDPGVVPASLFESELFGHRAGAFTGAAGDVAGRVERAERGSLVLDHVEELPLSLQPKLLRLLAEHAYTPLGGRERQADVRFLALGADDLERRVERGTFRADLFYRLEVLAFSLPPLRRRRRDLPALIDRLLADLAERFGRPLPRLDTADRRWMLEHPWPGNLRQLRNVLERALVIAEGDVLEVEPPTDSDSAPRPLAEVERDEIRRALAHTRGHQGRAAALLGISRKALWEKRKRYGLP